MLQPPVGSLSRGQAPSRLSAKLRCRRPSAAAGPVLAHPGRPERVSELLVSPLEAASLRFSSPGRLLWQIGTRDRALAAAPAGRGDSKTQWLGRWSESFQQVPALPSPWSRRTVPSQAAPRSSCGHRPRSPLWTWGEVFQSRRQGVPRTSEAGRQTPRWQGRRTSGQQGGRVRGGLVNFSRCPSPCVSRWAGARVQPGGPAAPGHGSGERARRPAGKCERTRDCAALRLGPAVH